MTFHLKCGLCGRSFTAEYPSLTDLSRRLSSVYTCPIGLHEAPGGFLNCLVEIKVVLTKKKE